LNGGVLSLTKGLAGDLAEKKIRVNVVTPGLVKTELWDKLGKTKEEQKATFENTKLPVGFVATPDDIAEAYLFLAKADYATGISVEIGKFTFSLVMSIGANMLQMVARGYFSRAKVDYNCIINLFTSIQSIIS
jgi:short-subunit dehydrogenase